MEAPGGFEPPHNGFADRPLSHLGMAPLKAAEELSRFQAVALAQSFLPCTLESLLDQERLRPLLLGEGGSD